MLMPRSSSKPVMPSSMRRIGGGCVGAYGYYFMTGERPEETALDGAGGVLASKEHIATDVTHHINVFRRIGWKPFVTTMLSDSCIG